MCRSLDEEVWNLRCWPSSLRWQAWSQGWQDYCLLDLAKKELIARNDTSGQANLNIIVAKVVQLPSPANLDAARDFAKQVLTK